MSKRTKTIKNLFNHIPFVAGGLLASSAAVGAGFSLYGEGTGYVIGNFAAGVAAEAADASTGWYNPAGLALIKKQQAVFGGVGIFPKISVEGSTSYRTMPFPNNYVQTFQKTNGARNALVPSIHYAKPIGERAALGFSVTSPFGLATGWSNDHPLRYAATSTDLLTTNFSPEIGGAITEHFSLGLGIDIQYARVKFDSMIGSPAYLQALFPRFGLTPQTLDSYSANRGDSWGIGFHTGGMLMFNEDHTRIGLNYQSRVNHTFHGRSLLTGRLASSGINVLNPVSIVGANANASALNNALYSNTIAFPDIVTLSGYQDLSQKWALLGSVVYTAWHTIKTIQLNNVAAFAPGFGVVPVTSTSSEFYHDAWRFAVGANYKLNADWLLRAGIGYDQTPVQDLFRTPRLPDQDRLAFSVGGHWQATSQLGLDAGYTYMKLQNQAVLNKTIPFGTTSTFTTNATASGFAHLVGAQLTWLFA